MPRQSNTASGLPDIKVFIRNARGKYLAQDANGLFFTEDWPAAIVLNYEADSVPRQLEIIRKTHGVDLEAEPVPLEYIYETCDRCKEMFVPFMVLFDGRRFLCPDCQRQVAERALRPGSAAWKGGSQGLSPAG
ncbi:MAG TPA: hypothetical protein VMU04_03200 [Candidatus Acidoferrum sp.]|nr:hypothetical protein [Candidatus Acidoferrum sp.]